MGKSPEPWLLYDRLEPLPIVVVTRAAGGASHFHELVDLQTDIARHRLDSSGLLMGDQRSLLRQLRRSGVSVARLRRVLPCDAAHVRR